MPTDIYFRTSLSGYNKNDVMRFIEKMNSEQVERVNDLNDQIRLSQTEARKLSAELDILRKKCDDLEDALASREKNDVINEQKAEKYDDMQQSFADIMLNAERDSKEKVRLAEEKAAAIVLEATARIEAKEREIEEIKRTLSLSISENKRLLERSRTEFAAIVDTICSSVEDIWSKVRSNDKA